MYTIFLFIFKINLYDHYDDKMYDFQLDDNLTGNDLKQAFLKKAGKYNLTDYKIRFLFGGAEIKDEDNLYQHNLKEGYKIQILVRKLDQI